jgi:hypothetical protein
MNTGVDISIDRPINIAMNRTVAFAPGINARRRKPRPAQRPSATVERSGPGLFAFAGRRGAARLLRGGGLSRTIFGRSVDDLCFVVFDAPQLAGGGQGNRG